MKAFPHHHVTTYDYDNRHTHGMDLRDYFAAKAMQSFCWGTNPPPYVEISECAYEMADAMIKAREKSK
jgi:hypothetical protein